MSEDQLSSRQAAAIADMKPSSWRSAVARGRAPRPDGRIGNSNWWWRDTLDKWKQQREAKS